MKIEEEKRKTEELEKKNQVIRTQIEQTRLHIQNLETQLNTIKSAKFFKLWQFYCKIKKSVILLTRFLVNLFKKNNQQIS